MPNGGVPINMLLRSQDSGHVIYCHAADMKVLSKEEWERAKSEGVPILVLNKLEAQVVELFVRYWLQDTEEGPICRQPGVDVEYDF
jgi:hypothetical protein